MGRRLFARVSCEPKARRWSARLRSTCKALAVLLALAGCASDPVEPVQPATRAALSSLVDLPAELSWAELKATSDCMAEHGFRFPPYEVGLSSSTTQGPGDLGVFTGFLTIPEAQQYGYGRLVASMADPDAPDPDQAQQQYLATLTQEDEQRYLKALEPATGSSARVTLPDGSIVGAANEGCFAEARRRVYGSVDQFLELVYLPQGISQFADEVHDDDAVEEAGTAYLSCLAESGYSLGHVGEAEEIAAERFATNRTPTGSPSEEERAMAVADATCQERSRLHQAYDNALIRAGSSWVNDNEGQLLALADLERTALVRAKRILQSP